jgi:signal peptidase
VLLVAFAFGAMLLVPTALGMHHYVVLTGSMTGTYDRGSIIFDKPVATTSLRVGDPITYSPPPGQTAHSQITHRINRIGHGRDGLPIFGTKGDNNRVQDPWTFRLPQPTQDKVVFHIPYAGYALGVLSDRKYRMFLIGIPALLVALSVIRGLFRDPREAEQSEAPGWGEGDIAEPIHDGQGPSADVTGVAPVFVTLGEDARPGARRACARAPRPAEARGPQIARLPVAERGPCEAPCDAAGSYDFLDERQPPSAAPRDAVAGVVALPPGAPAPSPRRRGAAARTASARGPRVIQLNVPQLHEARSRQRPLTARPPYLEAPSIEDGTTH